MPKVYNKHHNDAPDDAIYVGRGTIWGNPYQITTNNSREKVIALFEVYFKKHPKLAEEAKHKLRGKDLVCFCAPLQCHADVLLRVANE